MKMYINRKFGNYMVVFRFVPGVTFDFGEMEIYEGLYCLSSISYIMQYNGRSVFEGYTYYNGRSVFEDYAVDILIFLIPNNVQCNTGGC